jgi:hypothetical protein
VPFKSLIATDCIAGKLPTVTVPEMVVALGKLLTVTVLDAELAMTALVRVTTVGVSVIAR